MEVKPLHSGRKSQAAITDAIILLLVATFACTLIFSFVGNWGNDHDAVLRSAYTLNYMQSVSKSMYYIDASTLQRIESDGLDVYAYPLVDSGNGIAFDKSGDPQYAAYNLASPDAGCPSLAKYSGTLRVTDLLKRDLADSNPKDAVNPALPQLDDKFGDTAVVPGRTAMRCAVKELMKPFAFSGYKYYFEVLNLENPHGQEGDYVSYYGPEISNSNDSKIIGIERGGGQAKKTKSGETPGCKAVQNAGYDVLSVASPFQVLYSQSTGNSLDMQFVKYKARICIWLSREGV